MSEQIELMKIAIELVGQSTPSTAIQRANDVIAVYEIISNKIENFVPEKK